MRLFLRLGLCVLVLNGLIGALIANRLHAQAPAPPGKADPPAKGTEAEREAHLARMREIASSLRLLSDAGKPDSDVKLVETPVLRYSDQTRQAQESALWVWSAGGRPSAVLAIEFYPSRPRETSWLYEIASLSTERIGARGGDGLNWSAREPGLTFQALEGIGEPADKPARRLTQLKEIHRRFTAHEQTPGEGRIELRPLTSPLLRYTDTDKGVLDGAILAFANGTNPEVLLVLEARTRPDPPATWQYALVQLSGAEVTTELDGVAIWKQGEADPPAVRASYVNGWLRGRP